MLSFRWEVYPRTEYEETVSVSRSTANQPKTRCFREGSKETRHREEDEAAVVDFPRIPGRHPAYPNVDESHSPRPGEPRTGSKENASPSPGNCILIVSKDAEAKPVIVPRELIKIYCRGPCTRTCLLSLMEIPAVRRWAKGVAACSCTRTVIPGKLATPLI